MPRTVRRVQRKPGLTLSLIALGQLAALIASLALLRPWLTPTTSLAAALRSERAGEDLVLAIMAWIGVMLGLLTTLGTFASIATLADNGPAPTIMRVARRCALPGVRRLTMTALAASLSVSSAISTRTFAGSMPTVNDPVVRSASSTTATHQPEPVTRDRGVSAAGTPIVRADPPAVQPADAAPGAELPTRSPTVRHTIRTGEHLWGIAATRLRELGVESGTPSNSTIARYWARVVDLNRSALRSGDPNRVFPGERIILPAFDG